MVPAKISVAMPVHNGMPFLPLTVESVLRQTFPDFELVVIDDASTDETPAYLKALADPRIRYHRVDRVGLVGALNHCLQHAGAEIVARIDADDLAHPTRLQKQYEYLQAHPDCLVVGCQFDLINERGEITGHSSLPVSDEAIRWTMLWQSPILHPGAMFRRAPAVALGGYRREFEASEDYDLWSRLAAHGGLGNLPENLAQWRRHSRAVGAVYTEQQLGHAIRISTNYARTLGPRVNPERIGELYRFLATGRSPQGCSVEDLIEAFDAVREQFLNGAGDETRERIGVTQQYLRWRCLHLAERSWWKPHTALTWLNAAGRFDPERGTLTGMIRRKFGLRRPIGSAS
jgi:glycosyltransferase involved in cell wall biosynthesis